MDRKIQFRGLSAEKKEWVFGYLVECTYESKKFILKFDGIESGETLFEWVEVFPETVGQFTGMLDKNNNHIYEADVVSDGKNTFKVEWHQNGCKWWLDFIGKNGHTLDSDWAILLLKSHDLGNGYLKRRDLEVSNNIHEHGKDKEM